MKKLRHCHPMYNAAMVWIGSTMEEKEIRGNRSLQCIVCAVAADCQDCSQRSRQQQPCQENSCGQTISHLICSATHFSMLTFCCCCFLSAERYAVYLFVSVWPNCKVCTKLLLVAGVRSCRFIDKPQVLQCITYLPPPRRLCFHRCLSVC